MPSGSFKSTITFSALQVPTDEVGCKLELAMELQIMRFLAALAAITHMHLYFPDLHSVLGSIYRPHNHIYADIRMTT